MENWKKLKEDFRIQVLALHRDDWRKYTAMINKLVQQLSPGAPEVTGHDFFNVVGQEDFTVYIVRHSDQPENEFIGMATVFQRKLLRGWVAQIHDVVVDDKYARQGYGRLLTNKIFEYMQVIADREKASIKLSLTSKPDRVRANRMYQSECFELIAECPHDPISTLHQKSGTNLYRKIINPSK